MPRNGSGVYTLPAGNPVVPGTTIESSWANSTLEDVANELTNSLSRTGAGGMLAPFRIADGNVSAPGLSYLNETNSGLYRSGAGSVWMSILGVNVGQFSTTGLTIPSGKALTAQGNATVGGTFGVTGAVTFSSTLALTGVLTATGGVSGNITAASGTSTFNNVVINGDLDMNAGSSGTITNLPNPTNSGDAANKAYVDAQDALRLALTGGTLTGALAMSNNKITGVGTPTADGDAATKSYVDNVAQGLDAKASCLVATTTSISLSGTQTIDGVAVTAGQRVLVKDQGTSSQNGIYVCAAGSWTRSTDADTWDELVAAFTFIEQGTVNGNNGYICTVSAGGTLGTTAVTWAQFSGAGQITAGTGMSKTGNTLNVNTASASRIVVGADEIDLATTGVTASTYKSVTVDQWGRITAGTNPTTLSGFGISDAYTQSQTDTFLNAKLNLAGGTMSGAIAMGTNKITGMGDPTNAQDAATKNYIDTIFGSTTSAAASAAAAATSASNAAASASAASSSASSAASSAASAAASYDSFDDRYLGSKSADPTVDNDGNPLLTGALYWNSTVGQMRAYNGSAWVAAYLPSDNYTFTGNVTLSAGTANGVAYLNGSKVLTTGSALTFDGAQLGVNGITVGRGAGAVSTNTAVGASALAANTTGSSSVAVGNGALIAQTTGDRNVAVGESALSTNIVGVRNTAVGHVALAANTASYNTAFGGYALFSNTTADGNTSVGYQSAYSNTTGTRNAAFGIQALYSNVTGSDNTAIGRVALNANTASANTAVGSGALYANTSGQQNTATGQGAMQGNTTGSYNVAVGMSALISNTTASNNTAVGYQAAYTNTTGNVLTAVGYKALFSNTTGIENTAVGQDALGANTTGAYNTGVGVGAGKSTTTGSNNTSLGWLALHLNTTASNNTVVGYKAGYSNQTGANNVFVGYSAGYNADTSGGHTFVGYNAGLNSNSSTTANTFIGNNAGSLITSGLKNTVIGRYDGNAGGLDIRTNDNFIVISDGDGNPRIYNNAASTTFVSSTANEFVTQMYTTDNTAEVYFADFRSGYSSYASPGTQRGYIYYNGSALVYSTSSDQRLKENIVDAPSAITDLTSIKIRSFDWKENGVHQKYGVIAQELQTVAPNAISKPPEDNGMLGVDHSLLVPMMIKAIQELKAELDVTKAEVAALKGAN